MLRPRLKGYLIESMNRVGRFMSRSSLSGERGGNAAHGWSLVKDSQSIR
jgi:hypothetical protein